MSPLLCTCHCHSAPPPCRRCRVADLLQLWSSSVCCRIVTSRSSLSQSGRVVASQGSGHCWSGSSPCRHQVGVAPSPGRGWVVATSSPGRVGVGSSPVGVVSSPCWGHVIATSSPSSPSLADIGGACQGNYVSVTSMSGRCEP
jgi:hypothetical protein